MLAISSWMIIILDVLKKLFIYNVIIKFYIKLRLLHSTLIYVISYIFVILSWGRKGNYLCYSYVINEGMKSKKWSELS